MDSDLLRGEILEIPGIVGADFDGDQGLPAGVRVQLAAGADATTVSERVRQVLADHGMRPRIMQPDGEAVGTTSSARVETVPGTNERSVPPPPPGYDPRGRVQAAPAAPSTTAVERHPPLAAPPATNVTSGRLPIASDDVRRPPATAASLELVSIQETPVTTSVVATVDGRTAIRALGAREQDVAIAEAVLEAAGLSSLSVLSVHSHDDDGSAVVTVLVEDGEGRRSVGSEVGAPSSLFVVGGATLLAARAAQSHPRP